MPTFGPGILFACFGRRSRPKVKDAFLDRAFRSRFSIALLCNLAEHEHANAPIIVILVKNQSWLSGTVIGKCSHGGHYDASSLEGPTGGMNKETRSFLLSPHFYLHDSAASSAAEASQHYLNSGEL